MLIRALRSTVVAVGLAVALPACAPTPAPSEPSPLFSNDAEAFAAADETYRAYVDALNGVDLSDPETFEAVYAWTTGEANSGARETFSQMHASRWHVVGRTDISLLQVRDSTSAAEQEFELYVCLDVSTIDVFDVDGTSVVSPDRNDLQSMMVRLGPGSASRTGLLISGITGREEGPKCLS